MGSIYNISCRNKQCMYHIQVRMGEGFLEYAHIKDLENGIKDESVITDSDVKRLVNAGYEVKGNATFLCNHCNKWVNLFIPHILEITNQSPLGTIREFKVHSIEDDFICPDCGNELEYILNPKSSNNKCPRCGATNMKVGESILYD